jgi:bidirectional [NiFe] hydrogenase diaphorase subunit
MRRSPSVAGSAVAYLSDYWPGRQGEKIRVLTGFQPTLSLEGLTPITEMKKSPAAAVKDNRDKLLERAMSRHQYSGDALIEVLHTAQELYGYLSPERLTTIARKLRLPPSRVLGVASFYHFFSLEPKGEHTLVVCLGTACYVAGALGLLEVLQRRCGAGSQVSVQMARCIGSCGLAPAVIADGRILARVTKESLGAELDGLT